jgi:CheY-like chemotaxis protein
VGRTHDPNTLRTQTVHRGVDGASRRWKAGAMQASAIPQTTNAHLVLIVEDEATLAQTIELDLGHEGYRTERAADGLRGIELFRAARPDLVLLDLGLPKLDGLEVLRTIRAASDVPVVILTAREEEVDELLGLGMGADDDLVKPVSARKLLARCSPASRWRCGGRGRSPARCPRRCAWGRSRSTPTASRSAATVAGSTSRRSSATRASARRCWPTWRTNCARRSRPRSGSIRQPRSQRSPSDGAQVALMAQGPQALAPHARRCT